MAKHTVKIDEVATIGVWFKAFTMATSHGLDENKMLYIECKIRAANVVSRFAVDSKDVRVYTGNKLEVAVKRYNEA